MPHIYVVHELALNMYKPTKLFSLKHLKIEIQVHNFTGILLIINYVAMTSIKR